MARGGLARLRPIHTPMIPEPADQPTGEFVMYSGTRLEVYRRLRPIHLRSHVEQERDGNGNFLWQPAPQGANPRARRIRKVDHDESDPKAWEEFIFVDDQRGRVERVFAFREDPATVAAKAKEAERKATLDRVLDKLSGMSESAIAALVGSTPDAKPSSPEPGVFHMEHKGKGRWNVIDPKGEKVNDEWLTKEAAAELVAKLSNLPPPGD